MVEQFYDGNIQLPDGSTIHETLMKDKVEKLEAKVEELEKELDKLKDELKNAKAKLEAIAVLRTDKLKDELKNECVQKLKDELKNAKTKDKDDDDSGKGKSKDLDSGTSKDIYKGKNKDIDSGTSKDIDSGKNLILIAGLPGSGTSSGLARAMMNYEGGEYKEEPIKHVLFNFEGKNFVHMGSLRAHYPGSDSLPLSHQPIKDFLESMVGKQHVVVSEADQFSFPRVRRELVQHHRDLHRSRHEHGSQSCSSSLWLGQGVQAKVFEECAGGHQQYQSINASQCSDC